MAYPTASGIRTALEALATAYPFCTVMTLAPSLNGVPITALKVSKVTEGKRAKVLFTGGMHANELAPPRAVLSCIKLLLDSYKVPGTGITYNAFSLTGADVKAIVEHIDIYVAPMVNPDGYALALTLPADELAGRKNASPTATCALPNRAGVNLNRNFDIVWDFQTCYAPVNDVATSSDPCDPNYSGVTPGPLIGAPFSEPEAANVKTLLDEGIEYYIDCHMYGPTILYSWGIEENQTTDPAMSFTNPAFDGARNGVTTPPPVPLIDYMEYIPAAELTEVAAIANHMSKAIKSGTDIAGRGVNPYATYTPQPGALFYPCSGSADDYAFSRHIKDPSLPFVRAFTLECGNPGTTFRPTEAQFVFIEREVHCALLSLLKYVATWIAKSSAPPPPPPPPSNSGCGCPTLMLLGAAHPVFETLRHLLDVSFRETAPGRVLVSVLRRLNERTAPAITGWLARHDTVRRVLAKYVAEPVLTALSRGALLALRLPSPSLRVTALVVNALFFLTAWPVLVLAALWAGVRHG